jgi:Phage tail tube protein
MPTGYLRAAGETFPGNQVNTPTLSTKVVFMPLQSFAPKTGTKPLSRDDELRNQDEPLPIVPEAYDPSYTLGLRMYPDSLGFLLKLLCGAPETTAGNGIIKDFSETVVPTGATRHRWVAPFGPSGVNPLTAQFDIAYKDQAVFFKAKGAAAESLGITTPESGGATLSVAGPALYLDEQSDPSLSPSYEALTIRPFTRGNLTLAKNLTGTGTTEDFTLNISNPVETNRSLGVASRWADTMEKSNSGPIVVSGTIPKRILDTQDIQALKESTGFELEARWVSDTLITGAYPYKFTFKASNAQYTEGDPDPLANVRRMGAQFSWKSSSPSSGSSSFELVNATASYV